MQNIISINLIFYSMIGKSQLLKWQNIKVKENVILYNFLDCPTLKQLLFQQECCSFRGYYFLR